MILLISVVLLIIFTCIAIYTDIEIFKFFSCLSITITVVLVVLLFVSRLNCVNDVIERNSLQETLNTERTKGIETAAIALKIMEFNAKLANHQHWANNIWYSMYYTDEFRQLKPLR